VSVIRPHICRPVAALVLATSLAACRSKGSTEPINHGGRPVLFIGNSLTYVNDLPGIVQSMVDSAGGDSIDVRVWTEPDFALIDHWNKGGAQAAIKSHAWAFVVLQQGPSSVEVNRDTLRLATRNFAPLIAAAGAKPVLYAVWPTIDRREDFARSLESYALAASDVGGLLAPVSAAWLTVLTDNPSIALYSADGLHPTQAGSYLAALVIYARITGKSPIGMPAKIQIRKTWVLALDPAVAEILQGAAAKAIAAGPPR
jgi:hypothetical protein